jgi:hypothetical protein
VRRVGSRLCREAGSGVLCPYTVVRVGGMSRGGNVMVVRLVCVERAGWLGRVGTRAFERSAGREVRAEGLYQAGVHCLFVKGVTRNPV